MKTHFIAASVAIFTLPAVFADTTVQQNADGSVSETTVEQNADGSITETTRTFTPEVRQGVVTYFEPYATDQYGLPVTIAERINIEKTPAAWRTAQIPAGTVITEEYRPLLVPAPEKLVSIFPENDAYSYYIAGGNVVVIDEGYHVVDSIRIPSVHFEVNAE